MANVLQDPDDQVAYRAAEALRGFTSEPEIAIPALVEPLDKPRRVGAVSRSDQRYNLMMTLKRLQMDFDAQGLIQRATGAVTLKVRVTDPARVSELLSAKGAANRPLATPGERRRF